MSERGRAGPKGQRCRRPQVSGDHAELPREVPRGGSTAVKGAGGVSLDGS